jgi:two-component system cell cycle response regulator
MLTSDEPKARAKNALFKLLELSLPPTPENFTRFFYENDLPSMESLFGKLLKIALSLAESANNMGLERDLQAIQNLLKSDELALSTHTQIDHILDEAKSRFPLLPPPQTYEPEGAKRFLTLHHSSPSRVGPIWRGNNQNIGFSEISERSPEEASPILENGDKPRVDSTFEKLSQEANKLQSQMDHIRDLIQSMESRMGVIQKHNKKVSREANIDPLTGILNRRGLQYRLNFIKDSLLSLLIFDLDDFKVVNDSFGHNTGDEVLKKVAGVVRSLIRKVDLFSRLGGDEFVILMPGLEISQAKIVAERIRENISKLPILVGNGSVHVTASFGLTGTYTEGVQKIDDLLELADSALYQGKNQGKNQICLTNPIH